MRPTAILVAAASLACAPAWPAAALAADCPGNPDAIGTARTLVVDPLEYPRIGSHQYAWTLPLEENEVVLTLDDAPRPHFTAQVLDILARECIKATYFVIGRHAREFPDLVRRMAAEGHTVAAHSENHPMNFPRLSPERLRTEIQGSVETLRGILGEAGPVAPFFRIPGLARSQTVDRAINDAGLMLWSTDVMAHDWVRRIDAAGIVRRTLDRLAARGHRGVLLLHDIKPKTAAALPELLREFKSRGYRFVHVVPASADRPKTPTEAQAWLARPPDTRPLPALILADMTRLGDAFAAYRRTSRTDLCGEPMSVAHATARAGRTARKQAAGRTAAVVPDASPPQ